MKLRLLTILFLTFYGVGLTSTHARGDEPTTERDLLYPSLTAPQGSFTDVSFTYVNLGARASHVPLTIRDVPVEPHDTFVPQANRGPIETLEYNGYDNFNLSLMQYWQFERGNVWFNIGLGADWILTPEAGYGGTQAERNYTNDVGGDGHDGGARLTFLQIRQGGLIPSFNTLFTDFFLNWTPRASFEIAPFGQRGLLWLGTSISYFTVDLQNGWDRNNCLGLEGRRTYTAAYVIPIRFYATMFFDESQSFGITSGVQLQPNIQTNVGKESGFSIAPATFFVGFTLRG